MYQGNITGGSCPYCGRCPHCGMGGWNYPTYPQTWCGTVPQTQCGGLTGTPNVCNQNSGLGSDTAQGGTLSGTPNITT